MEEGHSSKLCSQLIHTQKKRKGFLLYHALSRSRGSASCRKGHSDVQHNNDVFRAVIMLSCGFRGKILQPQISAARLKAGTFGYFQNWLDVFSPVLTRYLLCAFLLGFLTFPSFLPHLTPSPSNNFSIVLPSSPF